MTKPLLDRAGAYLAQRAARRRIQESTRVRYGRTGLSLGGLAGLGRLRGAGGPSGPGKGGLFAILALGLVLVVLLPVMILQAFLSGIGGYLGDLGGAGSCTGSQHEPSDEAEGGIPSNYLALYQDAGQKHGINWTILAGIGRVETDHGRLDAEGVTGGTNFAGAAGPMQFLLSTWEAYGVDGNRDGRKDVYDPEDAVPAAAGYLKANGAPSDLYGAIFAYNHAGWYVDMVLDWAGRYARGGAVAVAANFGETCVNQALGPAPAGIAGKVIEYARAQLGDPYVWGAEGPDVFDCSGLVMMAYRHAGISIPRVTHDQFAFGKRVPSGQEQPGDLVFFRYDSGYVGHVGMVIGGGKMINAPQTGDVVKIASYQDRDDIAGFTRPAARAQA